MNVTVYDEALTPHTLLYGDQITVPLNIWRQLDALHEGTGPIYVRVSCDGATTYGRIRFAVDTEELDGESCRVPNWMWLHLGAPMPGEGWAQVEKIPTRPNVGTMTIRPRTEASLMGLDDPVKTLSEQISAAWSCVASGGELCLPCGTFDIMDIRDASGAELVVGAVLNTDVNLELQPALDYRPPRPLTPVPPSPPPVYRMPPTPASTPQLRAQQGFIPFTGTGYRLGSD